jgi:hypothetical protein
MVEAPVETLALDDKKKMSNPEFTVFVSKQQQVLNFLLSSLSKEILEYVAEYPTHGKVWKNMLATVSTQSRAHVINMHMAQSTSRKGNLSIAQYVAKMKALADDMASAGKKINEEELVGYILAVLDSDYDGVISAVVAPVESISVSELYGQLTYHGQRQELRGGRDYPSSNIALRGRGGPPTHGGFSRGFPARRGRGRGRNFNDENGE